MKFDSVRVIYVWIIQYVERLHAKITIFYPFETKFFWSECVYHSPQTHPSTFKHFINETKGLKISRDYYSAPIKIFILRWRHFSFMKIFSSLIFLIWKLVKETFMIAPLNISIFSQKKNSFSHLISCNVRYSTSFKKKRRGKIIQLKNCTGWA